MLQPFFILNTLYVKHYFMPKLYFLYCFLFCVTLNAQNFDSDWKTVYKFELDGKIVSAQKEVDVIYKKVTNPKEDLKTGDLITIRLIIKTENDLEFVHLKDLRASCFEAVDLISNYERKENVYYYKSTKDVATHFFFDKINKGTYVLEYDVRINNSGVFNDGLATIQSMYAPEFSDHSRNTNITID